MVYSSSCKVPSFAVVFSWLGVSVVAIVSPFTGARVVIDGSCSSDVFVSIRI